MKKRLQGKIISDHLDKTRIVLVTRFKQNRKYGKYFKITTKFKAHDESNIYQTGDEVIIEETRPLSHDKRWRIVARAENETASDSSATSIDNPIDNSKSLI